MSLPRVTVAVLLAVLAVGGCKTVTGRVWFPVYADTEEAVGEVTVHFTVDCGTAGRDDPAGAAALRRHRGRGLVRGRR